MVLINDTLSNFLAIILLGEYSFFPIYIVAALLVVRVGKFIFKF